MSEDISTEREKPILLAQRLEILLGAAAPEQRASLKSALELTFQAHQGQFRDDGTPYVVHPLRVACLLIGEMGVRDVKALCTALLHDAIEDSPVVSLNEITAKCGPFVAELVRILTKPSKHGKTHSEVNAEYFPRIVQCPDEAVRYVKLADRLDNLRDLVHSPDVSKRTRMLAETRTFYFNLIESLKNTRLQQAFREAFIRAIAEVECMQEGDDQRQPKTADETRDHDQAH